MDGEKRIIVAIEFGSSKIRGVAGCKDMDGSVQVLDIEQVDARNCIRRGVVYNTDKTVTCLKHIVGKLEDALDKRIRKAYVGIGGQMLRAKTNTVSRQFAAKTAVSQEIVDSLLKANRNTAYDGYEILEVVSQEYRVGSDSTTDPVGVLSNQIVGKYLNVIVKTEAKEYIQRCVEGAGIDVAGIFAAPTVLGRCVLTDMEKRSGCALVDFGYGTTTVSVYKSGLLRHLAVLPLGGNNITRDLCILQQIDDDEAEVLKMKYGSAFFDLTEEDSAKKLPVSFGLPMEEQKLVKIVEAREEEILSNVAEQIDASGYQNQLYSGIVLTGAASGVKNLDKAVSEQLHSDKTRFVHTVPFASQTSGQVAEDGSLCTLLALMNEGSENCTESMAVPPDTEETGEVEMETPKPGGFVPVEETTHIDPPKPQKKGRLLKKFKEKLEQLTKTVTEEE